MIKTHNKSNTTIIYIHIPKTGGSTLNLIIGRNYRKSEIFSINSSNMSDSINLLKNLNASERKKLKIIRGHHYFGLHEFCPLDTKYITILRHPVDRIRSFYYYILRKPNHYLYDLIKSKNLSFSAFLENKVSLDLDNLQVRLISGVKKDEVGFGECNDFILDTAKSNLDKYFLVAGLTEKFDETILLMKIYLGWKNILYFKKNVSKNKPKENSLSIRELNLIEKYNELDIQLYEYAKKKLQLQYDEHLELINKYLNRYKKKTMLLNRIYSVIYPFDMISPLKKIKHRLLAKNLI